MEGTKLDTDWDGTEVPESCLSYGQSGAVLPPLDNDNNDDNDEATKGE